jgi:polysaccharide biosynthesis transport protein
VAGARAAEAEAAARLSTARRQLARGSSGEDVGEALNSTVIQSLRAQRAEVSRQVADYETRYGARHPELIKARRQLADIDGQIQAEVRRIISNLDAQSQVARQRTASIEGSLNQSRGALAANNAASVRLNELQRNADSTRTLYQSFLDRFKQTSAQQGIEGSDAVIVSQAQPPTAPSSPNVPKGLLVAVALGLISGFAAVFLAEALQNGFSTSEELEGALGLPVLASIPLLSSTVKKAADKKIAPVDYVVDRPFSAFPEAFRNLRTSIEAASPTGAVKTIVMTSALPDEGKTTSAICLGRTMALAGSKVVLVDCDLRRKGLSRAFGSPEAGLLEVLDGRMPLEKALVRDEKSEAFILPLGKAGFTAKNVFGSHEMDELLKTLQRSFDFVVLDGAPVLPVADTRILAPKADAVVMLARWRKSPKRAVESALRELAAVGAPIVGAAFTQVDVQEQAKSGYGDAGYYYRAYSRYYLQ